MLDSKLFYGQEIGSLEEWTPRLKEYYPHSAEGIPYIEWLNTQIPRRLYLEVSYPTLSCHPSEMRLHLSMIEDKDEYHPQYLQKRIQNANYVGYGYLLGLLGVEQRKPRFYTQPYLYL